MASDAPALPDLPEHVIIHRGGADLGGTEPDAAAFAMAEIAKTSAEICCAISPDIVLIMGDRLDMVPVAVASLPFNLPLAHLHGGEVTEGAVDDRTRHALSKLAHVHFVASKGARARLLAMGEEAERIHVTGAPGLDTILAAPAMTRRAFLDRIGFTGQGDEIFLRLVTVHPETNSPQFDAPLKATLAALAARPTPTLFTAPNKDPGGNALRTQIENFIADHHWAKFIDTLGSALYPNALCHADVMIGNSSSGIIEAGLFGLPVIDIGIRQRGRERGDNVVSIPADANAILSVLDQVVSKRTRYPSHTPYGDGRSGARIAQHLLALPPRDKLLAKRVVS